jgi:hypothetical protein
MNKLTFTLFFCVFSVFQVASQTVTELMNSVSQDTLVKVIREFSGEDATVVNGNPVTILNRESNTNDIAADYLVERLSVLNNLTVNDIGYSANGRNIVATQLGKTNPDDIYIICAHYDTVNNFCADDNASGTAAILEVARILSTQCFNNTIIYAFWDEEEQGLLGAVNYAATASANGDNILGVYNIDMMAYDGDADNDFDIDVRNIASSIALKDDLLAVLTASGLNLNVNVVDPGTPLSDHKPFWDQGYSAMLVGESWANNDQTPNYHTANDRFADLDMDYFTDLTKLATAFMATKGSLLAVDNTVTVGGSMLTSNQVGASYRWLDCDNSMAAISGETSQSFMPSTNGSYAVEITSGSCVEISDCINFNTLGTTAFSIGDIEIFPNPVNTKLQVTLKTLDKAKMTLINLEGKKVLELQLSKKQNEINISKLANGVYFLKLTSERRSGSFKIVKE